MHKSHQDRLTTLSNQLKEKHAAQLESLRQEYESRLPANLPDKAQTEQLELKIKVSERMQHSAKGPKKKKR